MAKRFTQTDIWDEDWYLDLPKEYKLFWFYLKDQCNHAGIWKPNIILFNAMIGCKINLNKALVFFNNGKERISVLNSGHWFINDFFVFQYGGIFNPQNRVHKSIECIYNQEGVILTSIRGLKEVKDEDKVEDKDRVKDKDSYINKLSNEELSFLYYKEQTEIAKQYSDQSSKAYIEYCNHVCMKNDDNTWRLPHVLKIKKQVSYGEFIKLYKKSNFDSELIFEKVDSLQTNVKYHGKYEDIYLTINRWLNKK